MKINIKELLDFFDDKKDSQKGDANALMAILGEDLNASAYKHFRKDKVDILAGSVLPVIKKNKSKKGKRLDRWMLYKKRGILFQCEIKNWAATALGGRKLPADASKIDIKETAKYHWESQLSTNLSKKPPKKNQKHPNGVSKVLLAMRKPNQYKNHSVEPLLIYWMPISSDKNGLKPLSAIPVRSLHLPIETEFSKLHIFSVSLYLRQLHKRGRGQKFINLEMPHFEHRMRLLSRFQNGR
ncbi:hypothetical protein A3C86_01200 [Candidatus Kaiserbacteria bacterium RIFCSPHIGHO2_02_FULL_49_16]|uniref:Restriction endonuclease n=1 Tax=Candidatus Kaiserbacteria bacterium RIFCSPHIGHO2_02_FULL_49_16 TaxID=1798490 RepID=A0A1F6DGL2_9BACT|nr:MAG: hypothetical protein A3C86_01200 [Candidatus Kaiserbacteria bacterium RIFCSPHIGHO2_02_FULL_49_16]